MQTTFFNVALPLLYAALFAGSGVIISEYVFSDQRFSRRLWLGLVIGLFELTWFPSLFAFLIGFGLWAQILGLAVAVTLAVLFFILGRRHRGSYKIKRDSLSLLPLLAIFIIGCYLFSTHIINPKAGDYYGGQTTYGDLSMHLGMITSIAEQGFFPPEYSIFAGHTMSYPFLCETSSSSLLVLGANLRLAYLVPALWAYALVILGIYNMFELWLKRKGRALFATVLFFIGGGFGFAYFIDLINGSQSTLSSLLSTDSNNLNTLLNGWYQTPTNIPEIGLRWVNPIVDMLIPQRATLFGWAFLFPCLYLVLDYFKSGNRKNIFPLAIIAGGLPLIHTHSFVALALISAVYFIWDLIKIKRNPSKVLWWLIYAGIVVILAVPQLVCFTFKQTAEGEMIRFGMNWANGTDSFLWFYIKNMGWIFILMPFAFLCLSKNDRKIYSGVLLLWAVSEVILFQPNTYDNNKLLFVWYAFTCGLVTKLLGCIFHWAQIRIKKHSTGLSRARYSSLSSAIGCSILAAFFLIRLIMVSDDPSTQVLRLGTAATILFILGAVLCIQLVVTAFYARQRIGFAFACAAAASVLLTILIVGLLAEVSIGYAQNYIALSRLLLLSLFITLMVITALNTAVFILSRDEQGVKASAPLLQTVLIMGTYAFCFTLFISGTLTIIREARSEYMLYDSSQITSSEFIKDNTSADSIFLTDYSWHLNPVSALTGRSIVCGTDTFLFFHGIDTTERKDDICLMFESPAQNLYLFEKYSVDYIYIGASERMNSQYFCDESYFAMHFKLIYDVDGIKIFDVNQPAAESTDANSNFFIPNQG